MLSFRSVDIARGRQGAASVKGFTLVELMVALVVGLLLVGTTVGFVVAVASANSETIRSTRLTQELRAVTEIMARELRRARSVSDPIKNVGRGVSATSPVNQIQVLNGGQCITFGYEPGAGERSLDPDPGNVFRAISLRGGRIFLTRDDAVPSCTDGGVALSSPEVAITTLNFVVSPPLYQINVTGRLAAGQGSEIQRSYSQIVFVRSAAVPLP